MRLHLKKLVAFVCISLALSLPSISEAATMHVMMVGDTNSEDLTEGVYSDLARFSLYLKKSAYYSGLKHNELIFMEDQCSPEELYYQLERFHPDDDDVVVFFFSGHGYRTVEKGNNPWPNLFFSKARVGVDLEEVIQKLRDKNPRLILAFIDSCNNVMSSQWAPKVVNAENFFFGNANSIARRYKHLFVDQKGEVIAIGAEPGGFAVATDAGGIFISKLMEQVDKTIFQGDQEPSWGEILKVVRRDVIEIEFPIDVKQIPYYHIDTSHVE